MIPVGKAQADAFAESHPVVDSIFKDMADRCNALTQGQSLSQVDTALNELASVMVNGLLHYARS